MVAIAQEDLPYIVLTEDPNLAGLPDRPHRATIEPVCPAETGDLFCDAGLLRAAARARARSRAPRAAAATGGRPATWPRSAWSAIAIAASLGGAARGRAARAAGDRSRWSSPNERHGGSPGKVGAAVLTLIFVLIFNFFLFRVMGDPTDPARPAAAGDAARRSSSCAADYGLDKPLLGQFADYIGDTLTLDLGISQRIAASRSGTRSRTRSRGRCCWSAPGRSLATIIGAWMGVVAATSGEARSPTTGCSASACSHTRRPSTGSGSS